MSRTILNSARREQARGSDAGNVAPLAAAPVHVFSREGLIRLEEGMLVIHGNDGSPLRLRLDEVGQVSLHGDAGVTTPCLRVLMERGIPVIFRTRTGHYAGQTADLSGGIARVRRAQYAAAADPVRVLPIARAFVQAKIVNARGNVRRRAGAEYVCCAGLAGFAARAAVAPDLDTLRGIEGAAAALYFSAVGQLIRPDRRGAFAFGGRRRRPPADPVNALLSYLYAVVTGECAAAALAAGLDPNIGFLHVERPGPPALALDLVEPLRPAICDALALGLINRGEIGNADFTRDKNGVCLLEDSGRKVVLAALEQRLAQTSFDCLQTPKGMRELILADARSLASALCHDAGFAPRVLNP